METASHWIADEPRRNHLLLLLVPLVRIDLPHSNVAGVPETSDFRPSQANASGTNKEGNESLKAA